MSVLPIPEHLRSCSLSEFFPGEVLVAYQYSLDSDGLGFSKENSIFFSLGFFDPRTSLDCFHTNASGQPRVCWEPNWPICRPCFSSGTWGMPRMKLVFSHLAIFLPQIPPCFGQDLLAVWGQVNFFPYPETLRRLLRSCWLGASGLISGDLHSNPQHQVNSWFILSKS